MNFPQPESQCLSAASISAISLPPRRFEFERDTFAFANELVWEYRLDPASQKMVSRRNVPPPTYAHRCFVLVRSARQFFYHARFDATLPVANEETYRRIVREVVSRNPRTVSAEAGRVVVPGYNSLRSFSQAQAAVLKANLRRRVAILFFAEPLADDPACFTPASGAHGRPTRPLGAKPPRRHRASVPLPATDHQPRHRAV